MYRIIGADQKEYGPVTAEQLSQWVAQGRVNAQTLVRPEGGGEWKPLGTYPELAAASAGPAPMPSPFPGSSAPSALAPEVLNRDYHLDIGECISQGWELLKNNFGLVVGGTAIYLLIQGGMSVLAQIPLVGIAISLASIVITGPLLGGVYLLLLKVIRHEPADVGEVFTGFRQNFLQLFLGYLVGALLTGLAALPGLGVMAYPVYQMVSHHAFEPLMALIASMGLLLAFIPLIYFSVSWMFALPLIIDRQMEFWSALSTSRAMVGKHWWLLFGLVMVGGLINVGGICACCIGLFVTIPLVLSALMYAYERIFSSSSAPSS